MPSFHTFSTRGESLSAQAALQVATEQQLCCCSFHGPLAVMFPTVRQVEQGKGVQNGGGYRQEWEKPAKMKQQKVRGPEWGPQVKQTTLPAGPIYIGQAQGERNIQTEEPEPALSLPPVRRAALLISLDRRALTPER